MWPNPGRSCGSRSGPTHTGEPAVSSLWSPKEHPSRPQLPGAGKAFFSDFFRISSPLPLTESPPHVLPTFSLMELVPSQPLTPLLWSQLLYSTPGLLDCFSHCTGSRACRGRRLAFWGEGNCAASSPNACCEGQRGRRDCRVAQLPHRAVSSGKHLFWLVRL